MGKADILTQAASLQILPPTQWYYSFIIFLFLFCVKEGRGRKRGRERGRKRGRKGRKEEIERENKEKERESREGK